MSKKQKEKKRQQRERLQAKRWKEKVDAKLREELADLTDESDDESSDEEQEASTSQANGTTHEANGTCMQDSTCQANGTTSEPREVWTEERYMEVFGAFEPVFSESDVEREESLKVSVPTLPQFVSLTMESKSIRKIRRVETTMDGLFVYNGYACTYWPAVHELPKEFPLKEKLRRVAENEKEWQTIIDKYEKHYTLWHLYGVLSLEFFDNDDLVKNFTRRLNRLIFDMASSMYHEGIIPGLGNSWKANMIYNAKYQDPDPSAPLVLKTAKLLKKPFIKVRYNESRGRTDRVGPWKDDPDSDPESRASPPRYRPSNRLLA